MSGQGSEDAARAVTLAEFQKLTGFEEEKAIEYLEAADWDFGAAAQTYYADQDDDDTTGPSQNTVPEGYTGPRTLDGRPVPEAQRRTAGPSSSRPAPKRKGVATLGSLASSGHAGHDDDSDSDDDMGDDDEGRNPRDLFAGGEKSGLAVQDPAQEGSGAKRIINDILAKAKANASRPDSESDVGPSRPSFFSGSGQTLGGDGVESRVIPDPDAATGGSTSNDEPQERILHLWRDGFSIDDGELRRFDDPANAMDLNMIQSGRAPLHLMNVRYDQPVDVKLQQHDENYRPLPKAYKPFGGSGQRLGSDVPGESSTSTTATTAAAAAPATSSSASSGPAPTVDESLPTLTLRIQLPDGTRLPARFNTTQTVDDVYNFVGRASATVGSRPWVLATTFPNKEHTDKSLVLGEMPEFKRGGTAVVKWT